MTLAMALTLNQHQHPPQDNAELFAEEVDKEVASQKAAERQRMAAVPGLIPQAEMPAEDMADS